MNAPCLPRRLAAPAFALLALRAAAGPEVACPDGPDPLRFRPEVPIAALADVPEPLAVAASVDAADGVETIALALLTPARDVALTISSDGGCTFTPPFVVSSSGAVTERPAVAVRAGAPPVLIVAWKEGTRVLARSGSSPTTLAPAVELERFAALTPPSLAISPQGPLLAVAAWTNDVAGAARAVVARSLDGAAWAPSEMPAFPGTVDEVVAACDMAGAGGPGCTLLASLSALDSFTSRLDDPAGSWGAPQPVDDGTTWTRRLAALAAGAGAGPSAWIVPAWTAEPRSAPGTLRVEADGSRRESGGVASDFEGASGGPHPIVDASPSTWSRPAAAVASSMPVAFVAHADGGEIRLCRRALSDGAPRLFGGCGPFQLTGLSPLRSAGTARAPVAAALGDDVIVAFADDRRGSLLAWIKRSDGSAPAVTLTNAAPSACGDAPRVDLAWSALPCDAALVTLEVGTFAGGTDFTRVTAPGAGLSVEGLQPATGYFFRLRVRDTSGNEQVSNEVSALTPACGDALLRSSVTGLADACAAGGAGGDGLPDPGETLRLTVSVRNDGTGTAAGARARVVARSGFVTVRSPSQSLGDLAPGASATATFDLDVSATAPCGASLSLLLRADGTGAAWGDLVSVDVPAACVPCRLPACVVAADASRTAPREVCAGSPVTLDAGASTATDCAGTLLYEWRVGSSLVGTGAVLQQVPGASVAYMLTARCSTDLACEDWTNVDVVVHELPTITIAQDPPPPHCSGSTVTLVASSDHPGTTFVWSDGTTSDRVAVTAAGTAGVTGTDAFGCRRSAAARVDFGQTPRADAGPDVAGCGARIIGTPGYPLLDYAWSPPDGLSDPFVAQPSAAPPVPTTYTLVVTDPLTGCTAVDRVDVATTPGPGPVADLHVGRSGGQLVLSWTALAGASTVRAYSETAVREAPRANAGSATARRIGEGVAGCAAAMPPQALVFLQAVGVCADGLAEGPN